MNQDSKRHPFLLVILILGVALHSCRQNEADSNTTQRPAKGHTVNIEKVQGVWKAVDSQAETYGLAVQAGDTVTWQSTTNISLQFPINYHKYFRYTSIKDTAHTGYRQSMAKGGKMQVVIKRSATRGDTLSYAVLVEEDCVFAEGDSVPILIIM
ncbi:MAG: hypothetical protein R3222_00130 [Balneolaceae bacterium]|nr:hypothetical protein [Balneolaceae bacterium]